MHKLIHNLPFLLPALVLVGVLGYAFWFRDLPQAEGRITGDFAAATELAADGDIPLYVAVDLSPH
jgi:hypothetical protein